MEDKIAVAYVNKPVGVKGEMKVTVLLDNPKLLTKIPFVILNDSESEIKVQRVFKIVGDTAGIKLESIDNPEEALKLKGKEIFAKRDVIQSLIDENQIFIADIIGKTATLNDGEVLGKIGDVENYGASDILFIESKEYKELSFANIGGIIEKIDNKKNVVYLNTEEFWKVAVYDKGEKKDED